MRRQLLHFALPSLAWAHLELGETSEDEGVLEWALGHRAQEVLAAVSAPEGHLEGIALDRKTLRGTRTDAVPGLHLLSAVNHRLGLTLRQIPVGEKTNEIPLAHTLLVGLLLEGQGRAPDPAGTRAGHRGPWR
jgi:hypothetical protein